LISPYLEVLLSGFCTSANRSTRDRNDDLQLNHASTLHSDSTMKFTLRQLLLLVTVLCFAFGLIAHFLRKDLDDWDEPPDRGFFVIAVRLDYGKPEILDLFVDPINQLVSWDIPGEGVLNYRGMTGCYIRCSRRLSRGLNLSILANNCQSIFADVLEDEGINAKVRLCIIDDQGRRYLAQGGEFIQAKGE